MNLSPGIEQVKREERRLMWRQREERRLFRRHVEDAALILGGIAAIIVIIYTK